MTRARMRAGLFVALLFTACASASQTRPDPRVLEARAGSAVRSAAIGSEQLTFHAR